LGREIEGAFSHVIVANRSLPHEHQLQDRALTGRAATSSFGVARLETSDRDGFAILRDVA
jgi:hypothetical protein